MVGMAKARREILISEVYSRRSPWREDVSWRRANVANKLWEEVAAACSMTNGISKFCIPKIARSNTHVQSQHSMPAVPVFIVHLSNVFRFRGYEIMSAKFCKHVLYK